MQPRQIESNSNVALGNLLRGMLSGVEVRSEHTQVIRDHPGWRPDNLITTPGRSPVIIEAEYLPAATVEPEAKDRLGAEIVDDSRPVEAVIALRSRDPQPRRGPARHLARSSAFVVRVHPR